MRCPMCELNINDAAANFCSQCGTVLPRSVPVMGDQVGGHKAGQDLYNVGPVTSGTTYLGTQQTFRPTLVQPSLPPGKHFSILWGLFRYSHVIGLVLLLVNGIFYLAVHRMIEEAKSTEAALTAQMKFLVEESRDANTRARKAITTLAEVHIKVVDAQGLISTGQMTQTKALLMEAEAVLAEAALNTAPVVIPPVSYSAQIAAHPESTVEPTRNIPRYIVIILLFAGGIVSLAVGVFWWRRL